MRATRRWAVFGVVTLIAAAGPVGSQEPGDDLTAAVGIERPKFDASAVFATVNFDFASATLSAAARSILDGVARQLTEHPARSLELAGHTDGIGPQVFNEFLSEQRARAVREYLISRGIAAGRLIATGYGYGQPVDRNDTGPGRARNRRVDLSANN